MDYQVCLTPSGNCTQNIVQAIDAAKKQILVQAYNFTSTAQNKNAENLIILRNPELAKQYADNWYSRLAQSVPTAEFAPGKNKKSQKNNDAYNIKHKRISNNW